MHISQAVQQLQSLMEEGNVKLKIYIQTGSDSWEWKDITHFVAVSLVPEGICIDTNYN